MSVSKMIALVFLPGLFLAGCQTTRFDNADPAPLTPAPVGVVEQSELQPTSPTPPEGADPNSPDGLKPSLEPDQQVAVAAPPKPPADGGQPVSREALVGAWQVATGGTQCQVFLSLTKWSGGYRAASRGCAAVALSDVQAWDVKGKQVVLVNSDGGTAARLYRSAQTRYDGSTTAGGAISFSR